MKEGLIARERVCGHCNERMKLVECTDRSDGYKWECRRQISGKRHKVESCIRKGSWFDNSNLSLGEILKLTYWWCRDMSKNRYVTDLTSLLIPRLIGTVSAAKLVK